MRNCIFIIVFVLSLAEVKADTISLRDASLKSWIGYEINGKGWHWGECIQIEILNNRDKPLLVLLEAGRILVARDTAAQNMLITKTEFIHLEPQQKRKLSLYAMCANRFKSSPGIETYFDLGEMSGKSLLGLANLIEKRNYQNYAAQHAVWALSDSLRIENIDHERPQVMDSLHQYVSKVRGVEVPWYSLLYSQEKPFPSVNELITVRGNVTYYLPGNSMVDITLYNEKGEVIKELAKEVPHHPETYGYYFELDVRELPKEKYYITVVANNQVLKKLWMDLKSN